MRMNNKYLMALAFLFCLNSQLAAQKLNKVLEGFILNKVPTSRSVVGSKWVSDIGATTEGLPSDQIVVSRSLNSYSFDKETNFQLQGAIRALLGVEGYNASDLEIVINGMEVESIRDLYRLNLVKDEMVVFEAVKAKSFDLIYNKELEAGVKAKIPASASAVDIGTGTESKKRLSLDGANLYVAFKIIKVTKVSTDKKSKKIDKKTFKADDVMDYDISFNVNPLVSHAIRKTKEEIGEAEFKKLWDYSSYVLKYSLEKPVTISLVSESRGDMKQGIFQKVIEFCYCKSFGDIDGRMFLVNTSNNGKRITFDYILVEDFRIVYDVIAKNAQGEIEWAKLELRDGGKVTIISKSYHISSVSK